MRIYLKNNPAIFIPIRFFEEVAPQQEQQQQREEKRYEISFSDPKKSFKTTYQIDRSKLFER